MDAAAQAALLTQLQAQVLTLETDAANAALAAAAAAAAGQAPAQPVTVPVFTLAPALANTAAFLDLTTTSGAKHFKGATESLNSQAFGFEDPSDLQVFLDLVLKKSQVWGWNPVFTIPVTDVLTGTATDYNLLSQYGLIPIASVRAHVMTYYATPTRRAQDSFMACQCLLSSLTLDFLKLITADSNDYHLPEIVAAEGRVPAGPLLLKLIISKAHVDSRATVSFIRTSLTQLDAKMIELDSNIKTFNQYVKAQIQSLTARGETSSDLLINLFKGYRAANDVEFADWIRRKVNSYEEGEDVNANNLMADALVKYEVRKLNEEWSAPTKEQGQILALTAQVELLTKSSKKAPSKSKAAPNTGKQAKDNNKWAWKDVLPKEGEPRTKEFGGKHYHVDCKYHPNQWVCHSTAECSKNPANEGMSPPAKPESSSPNCRLKGAQLAASVTDASGLTEEESDGDDF
jgi:hypothetical protein